VTFKENRPVERFVGLHNLLAGMRRNGIVIRGVSGDFAQRIQAKEFDKKRKNNITQWSI
jgi:hypothetical protein